MHRTFICKTLINRNSCLYKWIPSSYNMTSQDLGSNINNIYISVFGPQFKSDSCTLKYAQNIVMIVRVA